MEIGKTKKREKREGATRAFRGVGFYSFLFFLLSFLPRSMGRRSRALFSLLLAGETRKAETRKERTVVGARSVWKTRRKFRRRETSPRGLACERPSIPRDFVLTLARDCVSLTPHEAFRIPINSRSHSDVVNFCERNSWLRLTLCCNTTDLRCI